METLAWIIAWLVGLGALAYHRVSLVKSSIVILVGLVATTLFGGFSWWMGASAWVGTGLALAIFNHPDFRRKYFIDPVYKIFQKSIPSMSDTEREALEAGTVGWDGELFSGKPQWSQLTQGDKPKLTAEEIAFINGPLQEVCEMVDEWEVCEKTKDLPPHVWEYIKKEGFFSLIIPKEYGGKEFSAVAHSEIIAQLSSRSLVLSTTVSVPNSLGPAELLMHYGTKEQKEYYLPRLAKGEEIPCFALTGPTAGSDAGSIPDSGVVCKGTFQGKEIIGLKLNWDKRYITLAPVATILGLAFKMYDPDHLLGDQEELGITCALIPTSTKGITIGNRHLPCDIPFMNGPTQGKDVFVPLDFIIGGPEMAGQGWRMLVECLSVGRAISLPSTSLGGSKLAAIATGAYSTVRRQFNTSISAFEGIQEAVARVGAYTYMSDATRLFTAHAIDKGEKPSVPSAITKYHVTEFGRKISVDAFDVHAGKAVIQGPNNYLAIGYKSAPIAITVEGANILTRCLIIFGQGAIRCHPHILKEMELVKAGKIDEFDREFSAHISYLFSNITRSLFHGLTFARFAGSPVRSVEAKYYRQFSRAASAYALLADSAMILLGGKLKFKESISARLGDCLSMLYIGSSVLKYFADNERPEDEIPFMEWSLSWCLNNFWSSIDSILSNMPNRFAAAGLRVLLMPYGKPTKPPKDVLNREITKRLCQESTYQQRLVSDTFVSENENDTIHILMQAFKEVLETEPLRKRLTEAVKSNAIQARTTAEAIEAAVKAKILNAEEATRLAQAEELSNKVIAVDDFPFNEVGVRKKNAEISSVKRRPVPIEVANEKR